MTTRATTNPKYLGKFILIGLFALLFGLYHLYDPIFVYPGMTPTAEAYDALALEDISDGDKQRKWADIAAQKGWPIEVPYTMKELAQNTAYSYFVGVIFTFLIGLPCLVLALMNFGSWFEANDEGLTNRKGQSVRFDQITKIDKTKWEKKGIAKLEYDENGKTKTFVIDDLKHDRETSDAIMAMVEEKIGADKIDGGKSEAEYQKLKAEAVALKKARDDAEMAEIQESES